jgi:site-specific DNA recombinase
VENAWPAIIDEAIANQVSAMVSHKRGNPPGSVKKASAEPFALSGKIFCGQCGRAMNGVTSGRKGAWRYYRCTKARDAGASACSMPQIAQKRIEDAVLRVFSEQVMTDGLLEDMIEVVREGRDARKKSDDRKNSTFTKNLAELERRKKNLVLAVEAEAIDLADAKPRITELNQQIAVINADLKKSQTELAPIPPAKKWNLKQFRKQLLGFMELDRPSALGKIADSFVNRVVVYPDKIDVQLTLVYQDSKSKAGNARNPNYCFLLMKCVRKVLTHCNLYCMNRVKDWINL